MKTSLLLLLSLLLFVDCLQAQNAHTFRKFGAGVFVGPQLFGKMYTYDKPTNVSGIIAGLDLRYAFSQQPRGFSLHFQPSYNTFRHLTTEGANTQFYRETTWRWEGVHLPLLLRYTFTLGKIRPFAELGPTFRLRKALTIHNQGYYCGFVRCGEQDFTMDLQSEINKDLIILTAAAGVEIDIWKVTIPISVRLQEGVSKYEMKEYLADGLYYDKLKTSTIQVTAGVSF